MSKVRDVILRLKLKFSFQRAGAVRRILMWSHFLSLTSIPRKHLHNERVTIAAELGIMSKNNLRGITLGIRPI